MRLWRWIKNVFDLNKFIVMILFYVMKNQGSLWKKYLKLVIKYFEMLIECFLEMFN